MLHSRLWLRLYAVITKQLFLIALMGASMQVNAQMIPHPDVPDKIKAPAGEEVVLVARASGSQIYTCQQGSWTLKAPEAELRDQKGNVIGSHFAGPTWKHSDGSQVNGKAAAKVEAPEADSIPWLLVSATGHSGNGVLSNVTSIQRIHTKGGQPPAGACDGSGSAEKKVAYTADYYFYAPK